MAFQYSLGTWIQRCDERIFGQQARAHSRLGDAVLPRLSHVADKSVLWAITATVIARTGGRRGGRAASRGVASIAVASFIANQIGKRVFRRARPQATLVPRARRADRIPLSLSFPSGHSASAAAFAIGASLEMPELAVPLGLTAAAVGWSRVYTGVHYPSDVLAGFAVGAGSAALLARLVPAPDIRSVRGFKAAERVWLPARPAGEGVVVVVNGGSGPRGRRKHLDVIRRALPAAEFLQASPENLTAQLEVAATRADVLVISGGDGSVNAAAAIAVEHGLPLAVLPGGTFNHFAADLGIRSVTDTVRAIRAGSAVKVMVSRVGGPDGADSDLFLNTFSLAGYPAFVTARERWEGRLGKPIAAALAVRSVLRESEPEDMVVEGTPRRVGLMFVGSGGYEPLGFVPGYRPSLGTGLLDVRLLDIRGHFPLTRLIADLMLGRVSKNPGYVGHQVTELRVERRTAGLVALDGEARNAPASLLFSIDPRALVVMAPPQPWSRRAKGRPEAP